MVRVSAVMGIFIVLACAWNLLLVVSGGANARNIGTYLFGGLAILSLLGISLYIVPQRVGELLQIGALLGIAMIAIYLNFVDTAYVKLMGDYSPLFVAFLAYPLCVQYLESGPPLFISACACVLVIMGNLIEHSLIKTPGDWKAAIASLPLLAPVFFLGLFIFNRIFWEKGQRLQAFNSLITREKRSLESLAALGVSVGTITHDMKGRLSLQRNVIELMRKDLASRPGQDERDARILACTELLARSSAEMQAFSEDIRSWVLTKSVPESSFDLRDILRGAEQELKADFGDRIAFDLPEGEVRLWGSPFPYIQIVSNLARNAAEAGSKASVILRADPEGRAASIEVTDDGPGIARCSDCAFDRTCGDRRCGAFEIGKTRKSDGSGIGMISVFGNLERIGASLRIESGPRGTSIVVSLPLVVKPTRP
jgi:signal transduction histidine kinase